MATKVEGYKSWSITTDISAGGVGWQTTNGGDGQRFLMAIEVEGYKSWRFTTNVGAFGGAWRTANDSAGQIFLRATKEKDSPPTIAQVVQAIRTGKGGAGSRFLMAAMIKKLRMLTQVKEWPVTLVQIEDSQPMLAKMMQAGERPTVVPVKDS